ncbi:hypothetical protein PISMIDRAFT_274144 [Pisolithus microcarpus 441]|uniref:Uncharacterized protein n=1 Tax=Pisolithus microcarpus 441 TaxID=765257 RepID=A0A0C9ZAS4_9AGAM|nr:hypothetical protein BKA83DRAFT_274144 [Pisolithus microcarpus]KIK26381.1 hypothetical protein PISMIDRAFT_274144 [Pisolithus microcarpus 441]
MRNCCGTFLIGYLSSLANLCKSLGSRHFARFSSRLKERSNYPGSAGLNNGIRFLTVMSDSGVGARQGLSPIITYEGKLYKRTCHVNVFERQVPVFVQADTMKGI